MQGVIQSVAGIPGLSLNNVVLALFDIFILSLRLGSFLVAAPFFGSQMVPLNVRIIFSFMLAFFLYGWVEVPTFLEYQYALLIPVIFFEIVIGLTAGLIFSIAFSAAALAGEKIAATSGLSFALQVDPSTGTQSPVIGQFLTLFLLVVFFASDVHLLVFFHMLNSYAVLPIGSILQVEILYSAIFGASNTMFQNAVLIMLPIVGYILLINLVVGIITRSAPQLNLFSFGFPITILSTIVILFFSISPLANMLVDIVADHADVLADLILELSNGRE